MKKILSLFMMSVLTSSVFAMEPLSDTDLQAVEGQAGADLSLKLSLNHINTGTLANPSYQFDTDEACKDLAFCHMAISVNKRFVKYDPSKPSGFAEDSESGNKLWIVFKGIQGTIDIQKLGLDGVDLIVRGKDGVERIKPAIQLSLDPNKPLLIRNLGFNSVAIEQDNFSSSMSGDNLVVDGSTASTPLGDYAYLKSETYNSTNAPNSAYDYGREKGFMGMQMNGNLVIQGKMMMFSCDANHPRC